MRNRRSRESWIVRELGNVRGDLSSLYERRRAPLTMAEIERASALRRRENELLVELASTPTQVGLPLEV